mgnify:CR=1 FL=1
MSFLLSFNSDFLEVLLRRVHDGWRGVPGVPRLSFAQPCWGTVITVWPEERMRWILKDTAEKTQPWHPTAYVVMHPLNRLFARSERHRHNH